MEVLSSFTQMINAVTAGLKEGQEAIREPSVQRPIQISINGGERVRSPANLSI
jgi:hypothetical protein